jgi:AdoMet-dependent rRNA methyltransferase SPB1
MQDKDGNESTDTEDEFAALDEHAQAEVRAMARKWLGGRKGQISLMDAAYNRYTFDDDGVPRWFREDERRHMRPAEVVSRDAVAAEKQALRAIDATSLKKVRVVTCRLHCNTGEGVSYTSLFLDFL